MQRWCYRENFPGLVRDRSSTWTKQRHISILQRQEKGQMEEKQTLSLIAVLGSMTLRLSRVSCVREVPICPCFMTKCLGMSSWVDGQGLYSLCEDGTRHSHLTLSASHASTPNLVSFLFAVRPTLSPSRPSPPARRTTQHTSRAAPRKSGIGLNYI